MDFRSLLFLFLLFSAFSLEAQSDTSKIPIGCFFGDPVDPASYIGGRDSLISFLNKNIRIPAQAVENKVNGKVYARFIITKTGAVTNPQIKKGIPNCADCDQEVLRVIKLMPAWIPAVQVGDSVESFYTLPIIFNCSNLAQAKVQEATNLPEPLPPPDPQKEVDLVHDCGDPEFIGGHEALMAYIQNNLSIPDSCIIQAVSTKIWVKLLINTSGNVSHVELQKAEFLTETCKTQIEQVFYEMPKWNPGIIDGQVANRFFSLPITIELREE